MVAEEFKSNVLQQFYHDMHATVENNYSFERFSFDGVDRSGFDAAKRAQYLDWFIREYENVFRTYATFSDQPSRDLYVNILRFKLAGHSHVRIDNHVAQRAGEVERFAQTFVGAPSELLTAGMFGSLVHYDNEWNGVRYTIDTMKSSLAETLVLGQYFFERDGLRIAPEPGDYVIDGGACTGETAIVFSRCVGPTGHVYAFDPVADHVAICAYNFLRPDYRNVTLFAYGLSDRSVEESPVKLGQYAPGWRAGLGATPLCRIDDLVIDGRITKVDFVKFDIEGSEMSALRGALATLHKFRPKLAISIYHEPNDFFEICNFLNDQKLGYRFYLDHYTIHAEETVLYALT